MTISEVADSARRPNRRAAVVPHAPLLLPEVSPASAPATESIRAAVGSLDFSSADVVVLLSPHGRASGVYRSVGGSLRDFGVGHVTGRWRTDEDFVRELADRWQRPVLEHDIDHGVLVPLLLASVPGIPVVAATLVETTSASTGAAASPPVPVEVAIKEGRDFATALSKAGDERAVFFVASVNTSAGLTDRAPLTKIAAASDVEREVLTALGRDVGRLEALAAHLGQRGGSCAAGPLVALSRLFAGRAATLLAYGCPVGVGYPVAVVDPSLPER